jgi:cell division protein FtsI/penicillin-binding protein 2
VTLLTTGCSLLDSGDDPRDDVEAFAAALQRGRLEQVAYAGRRGAEVQQWWQEARAGMGEARHAVRVESVASDESDEDIARARLSHSWTFGENAPTWSYETTVRLVRRDDAWLVALSSAAVAPKLSEGEHLELSTVAAERADILGAGGTPLVTERPVLRFGIDKTQVSPAQQAESARALARLLGVDASSFVSRVEAAGDQAFVEALVLRDEDVSSEVSGGYESITGALALSDEIPLAPTREFARALLGTVGPVTAEVVEKSEGAYQAGDSAGLSGLQERYDEQLRGQPGLVVQAVPGDGGTEGSERVLFEAEPEDGTPLRLTLDPALQSAAEQALSRVGPASALVALRPSSGELLVAAEGPGSGGYATGTVGQYAPGSTFKVVTSLALLRAGMSPDDTVTCPARVEVDGKEFKNYSDYPSTALGEITLQTAIAQSCNTALIRERDRISPDGLAGAAAALGLGEDHDIGFPAFFGSVPTDGSETEQAAAFIGQGRVIASPLAMATVAGSVASGRTVVPWLVAGTEVQPEPQAPLTGAEAQELRRLMAAVVQDGSGRFLGDVPGGQVLAKTGTAEFGDRAPLKTHAWMIAAQRDLAVAVFVEEGESGSATAGPILEEFLRAAGS